MKFLEKFSIDIFEGIGSFDSHLKNGMALLDEPILAEIREWIISQQTKSGGFPDRGGKCDLYYTLFGFFLTESLEVNKVMPGLKDFVQQIAKQQDQTGIDLFCLAILYASLFPDDPLSPGFVRKIRKLSEDNQVMENGYSPFLILISLMFLGDHTGVWRILKSMGRGKPKSFAGKPCPVIAAELLFQFIQARIPGANLWQSRSGQSKDSSPLMDFYRGDGGFAALTDAPATDLLSTAVALFALKFMEYDLRLIKPDCLNYVDGLYYHGGFSAGAHVAEIDVEYTFYGLLALGALA